MRDHITQDGLNVLSDRRIQEKYHDLIVDSFDDLSGSLWLGDEIDLYKKEMDKRGLEPLPDLNGVDFI